MKDLLKTKVDNELFNVNNIDNGLFSYNRDLWNGGEFNVIEKMLENKILNVESFNLCSYDDVSVDEVNINDFKAYHNERRYCVLEKLIAYTYLSKKYEVLLNQKGCLFYIPKLNLYLNHDNQTILEFINLCSIKNANIGVISSYGNIPNDITPHSLSIRIINVKEVFHYIYNESSVFAPKDSLSRKQTSMIDLRSHFKERYDIVRAYGMYRRQVEEELKLHNQRTMVLKVKPIKYSEYDIDIFCQRFLNDIINKNNKMNK